MIDYLGYSDLFFTFNRTIVELKSFHHVVYLMPELSFNRTIVELKLLSFLLFKFIKKLLTEP